MTVRISGVANTPGEHPGSSTRESFTDASRRARRRGVAVTDVELGAVNSV